MSTGTEVRPERVRPVRAVALLFGLLLLVRLLRVVAAKRFAEAGIVEEPLWGLARLGEDLLALAPLFLALLLTEWTGGPDATRALVQRATRWRAPARAWLAACVPLAVLLGGLCGQVLAGAPLELNPVDPIGLFGVRLVVRVLVVTFAFEVAWRGFAQEGFRGTGRYWSGAVGIGLAMALVHSLRPQLDLGVVPLLLLALPLGSILSVYLAWIYRLAEGSVVPGWIATSSGLYALLLVTVGLAGVDELGVSLGALSGLVLCAAALRLTRPAPDSQPPGLEASP